MFVIELRYDPTGKTVWWAGANRQGWPEIVTERRRARRFWTKKAANDFIDRFDTVPVFLLADSIYIVPRWRLF